MFWWVVAFPIEILVSVGGFPVNLDFGGPIFFNLDFGPGTPRMRLSVLPL